MIRASALAIACMLAGCTVDSDAHGLAAWLAPICVFNCVVSVTYAPGVERLATEIDQDTTPHR